MFNRLTKIQNRRNKALNTKDQRWVATREEILFAYEKGERNFKRLRLFNANFSEAYLEDAVFDGAYLDGCNFSGSDLRQASFKGAFLDHTDFSSALLRDADFSNASLFSSSLYSALAGGANFHSARLMTSNLNLANFKLANLENCNLQFSSILGTKFHGANLNSVDFNWTNGRYQTYAKNTGIVSGAVIVENGTLQLRVWIFDLEGVSLEVAQSATKSEEALALLSYIESHFRRELENNELDYLLNIKRRPYPPAK